MSGESMILGIDIGSVAVGVAKISCSKEFVAWDYRFHQGDVAAALQCAVAEVGGDDVTHIVATGSTPDVVEAVKYYDDQVCVIEAARHFHPDILNILMVGGEKFFLSRFGCDGNYQGTTTNTSCAAGTGSFLDQQASRLKMESAAELSATALRNSAKYPLIASRCAVFAKTDLIHAQQEGFRFQAISDGLCYGLAKNIVDTLFDKEGVAGEVVFCGGVSKNAAVVKHIEKLAGVRLIIPEYSHLYGAAGAALSFLNETAGRNFHKRWIFRGIFQNSQVEKKYYYPPLQLKLSTFPDFSSQQSYKFGDHGSNPVEVDIYRNLQGEMAVYLGVDVGSTSTKAVLIDSEKHVLVGLYTRTAGRPLEAVKQIFKAIDTLSLEQGVNFHVLQSSTTGSGRKFIGKIIGADVVVDEITAHARAATDIDPAVDTIIEIGGQDAKFTTLQNGQVTSSIMNNVCAAGTGSFIEEQAARLGCNIESYAERTYMVRAPMASDRCTVFMERDINHHLSEGFSVDEVLASALHSVRENYLMKVAMESRIGEIIFFQGATAKNKSLVATFEQRLQKPIVVSKYCHLTGALGAAIISRDEVSERKSSFKGFALCREEFTLTTEICDLCNNNCKISVADAPSGKVAYGFLCGRDYADNRYVKKEVDAIELLSVRRKLAATDLTPQYRYETVIGLPAAVHMVDDLKLWQHFFAILGLKTITSTAHKGSVSSGKKISNSEFCAPITAMHGHVEYLADKVDYVFLPYYLENKHSDVRRQYCYYTQFLPGVMRTVGDRLSHKILSPVIRYLYTSFHTKMQLYRMLKDILPDAPSFLEISQAYDAAWEYDRSFRTKLREVYNTTTGRKNDVEVVFLGRPYTVLSPDMNSGIPDIFASLGVDCYYQDMLSYENDEVTAITPLLEEIHWQHAAKILEAAEVLSKREGLYPVYITSFKCSPDSFTLDYFKKIMAANNKPYLVLELDEHDSSVGYETRIEAAIRSFRNHFKKEKSFPAKDYRRLNPQIDSTLSDKTILLPNWDRITCTFLAATLEREGYNVFLVEESDETIRRSLRFNSGECIPLNAIAEGYIHTIQKHGLQPENTVLWLNYSTLACNIRLYPHHIKSILQNQGYGAVSIYTGDLGLTDVSLRAAINGYFSYMFGGLLRRVACSVRPYEKEKGKTDRILDKSIEMLADAFLGKRSKEEVLGEVISRFQWIETKPLKLPKVAIFGDLYVRDNRVMNQDLIRFIEEHGGEAITTPYSEYAKMIAGAYFRKWFNEGKYFNVLANKAILATMVQLEKKYAAIFGRMLEDCLHNYNESPADILASYKLSVENTGESMDNILKIHYIHKFHKDVSLFIQASPALCCASLVTESMKKAIETKTGVPVVSITYDGTGGNKNAVIVPYLKFGTKGGAEQQLLQQM